MTNKPCPVCIYLKTCTDDLITDINSLMVSNGTKKKLENLLSSSKVFNSSIPPTFHYFEKHRDICLKGFVIKDQPILSNVRKNVIDDTINSFKYSDYTGLSNKEIRVDLKDRWLKISCKFTDIIEYRLINFDHFTKDNGCMKETVAMLKSVLDLLYFDSGKSTMDEDVNDILEKVTVNLVEPKLNDS